MQSENNSQRIYTDDNMMETRQHGSDDFPFQYYLEDVWDFDLHLLDWHWHTELEFVAVREGELHCRVGGESFNLHQGQGLVVNSRVIHRFEAEAHNLIPNVVFHPSLLSPEDSLIYRKYVQPVLEHAEPYVIFDPGTPWQKDILRLLDAIFTAQTNATSDPFFVLRQLLEIWYLLERHIIRTEGSTSRNDHNAVRLQMMMSYIHENYNMPITLKDIASSVFISKSSAMQLFQTGIHTSPVAYLIQYRLKRASRLLATTDQKISAIAEETGFHSAGYFCRKFRELYACSPAEYRLSKHVTGDTSL